MTRFEKIHNMTPEEMADAIFENGIDDLFDFCESKQECSDYDE